MRRALDPGLIRGDEKNLEALSGDRIGEFSIRINEQYRICFKWGESGPYDVEVTDYH
jgi:proteic killer suppression protein